MSPQQLIPLAVIPVAIVLVLLRNRRKRVLRPHLLWVVPAIVGPLILLGVWGSSRAVGAAPFGAGAWAILLVGGVLGGVAGWWRGETITIEKEPDGSLRSQASPLGLVLVVALFAFRGVLRPLIESHAAQWRLNALAVTEAFLVFALALIVLQRVEMYIRARRILAGGSDARLEVVT
ncbi:DUF1453 domain-containing protein [Brevundimonas sp.]|uniref:DUF1453 domain-containing protein n=1 Tax=Brevundimonas sp. TaxID=1871086 RepID=UPI0035B0F280